VKLFDIFEISCQQHEGIKRGNRAQCILQKAEVLDFVRAASTVGNGGRDGDSRPFNLLNQAVFFGFWQQFCKSVRGRHQGATLLPYVEVSIIGHELDAYFFAKIA
jgi:hypothetical protein